MPRNFKTSNSEQFEPHFFIPLHAIEFLFTGPVEGPKIWGTSINMVTSFKE